MIGPALGAAESCLVLAQTEGLNETRLRAFPLPFVTRSGPPLNLDPVPAVRGWSWFPPHADGEQMVLISDLGLPDGTGIELVEKIKARCQTPVILVTRENVGRIAAEAVRSGTTDYVVKFGDYLLTIPLIVEKNLTVAKVERENKSLRHELELALSEVRTRISG